VGELNWPVFAPGSLAAASVAAMVTVMLEFALIVARSNVRRAIVRSESQAVDSWRRKARGRVDRGCVAKRYCGAGGFAPRRRDGARHRGLPVIAHRAIEFAFAGRPLASSPAFTFGQCSPHSGRCSDCR
jgi:hypothetical protein